jgi:hypothetical protein
MSNAAVPTRFSLAVTCPKCGAKPGEKCKTSGGRTIGYLIHGERARVVDE